MKIKQASLLELLKVVNIKYVKLGYHYLIEHALFLLLFVLCMSMDHVGAREYMLQDSLVHVMAFLTLLAFVITMYFKARRCRIYLVDFSCYKGSNKDMCSNREFMRYSAALGVFNEKSLEFQRKICERSGVGEETYLPRAVISEPPNPCMAEARLEAEHVMFGSIDELFAKTGMTPNDVGVLIVNCSLFVPTPSLSSVIVNHYKMRSNIHSVNLGGMGCSAGVISIDLAKHLLSVHPHTNALVVTMENITLNWYWGNDRSKLVSNCIFRVGGAAILLSNKRSMRTRSKYELLHSVRTHKGADDKAFSCVFQDEDFDKNVGVSLSKELMAVAGNALKANIITQGPVVLPLSEQILFFASLFVRRVGRVKVKPYKPDFKRAFEHFCIHAGGRAVLDELEKSLDLTEWHIEPSRMTLYRFGNTSSSSLWYELAYSEAKGRVKKGDRVWQIAFGSGFKCNSAVWRSLKTIKPKESTNVWSSFVDNFPVKVPTMRTLC